MVRSELRASLAVSSSSLWELQVDDLHFDGAPAVELVDDRLEGHAAAAVLFEILNARAKAKTDRLHANPTLTE